MLKSLRPIWKRWVAGALLTSPIVFGVVCFATIVLLQYTSGPTALLAATVVTLVIWGISAALAISQCDVAHMNRAIYNQLKQRYDELRVRLEGRRNSEAQVHYDRLNSVLSPDAQELAPLQWVSGFGYIELWNRIHRIEEALIADDPLDRVLSRVLHETSRLNDSTINGRDKLLAELVTIQQALNGPAADHQAARTRLREISQLVNQYRDERWMALVRARNLLHITGLLTALVAYVLLGVALLYGAGPAQVTAGVVFYLLGAIVSLFQLLLTYANSQEAVEDYGLTMARLVQAPLFSGLAAIGGVALIALLPAALDSQIVPPGLATIFDLAGNLRGLMVAAAFGLTPQLLIGGLLAQSERYKRELQQSEVASPGNGG